MIWDPKKACKIKKRQKRKKMKRRRKKEVVKDKHYIPRIGLSILLYNIDVCIA